MTRMSAAKLKQTNQAKSSWIFHITQNKNKNENDKHKYKRNKRKNKKKLVAVQRSMETIIHIKATIVAGMIGAGSSRISSTWLCNKHKFKSS